MTLFFILGITVGTLGTIMGIGGGIILIPILLTLYPELPPNQITAMSLFCVAVNSAVGSISYILKKKVHFKSAVLFSIASLPGAWAGVQINGLFQRESYEKIFGSFLLLMGIYLFLRKKKQSSITDISQLNPSKKIYALGIIGSFFVGAFASVLGLGGGIIHVPFMTEVLNFPAHIAVATSHSILSVSTVFASLEHYLNGTLTFSRPEVLYIALGILIGAPIGAKISSKLKDRTIIKALSIVLILTALKFIF